MANSPKTSSSKDEPAGEPSTVVENSPGSQSSPAKLPPANRVHENREALGLSKVDLARLAKLSDKTIGRIERQEQRFRSITYWKILNALNRERRKDKVPELTYEEVFPTRP